MVDGWWMLAMMINYVCQRLSFQLVPNMTHIIRHRESLHVRNHLVARRRIQPAGRLVQKENLRTRNQLAGDTDPPLLSAADALADRRANQRGRLVLDAKRRHEGVDALASLRLGDRSVACQ